MVQKCRGGAQGTSGRWGIIPRDRRISTMYDKMWGRRWVFIWGFFIGGVQGRIRNEMVWRGIQATTTIRIMAGVRVSELSQKAIFSFIEWHDRTT